MFLAQPSPFLLFQRSNEHVVGVDMLVISKVVWFGASALVQTVVTRGFHQVPLISAILASAACTNESTATSVAHTGLLAYRNPTIPTLIADQFNIVERPLRGAPHAATLSCFAVAPHVAHAALTLFSVAPFEDIHQAAEDFVAAFVEIVEHNVLAAIAIRNSNLVELDPYDVKGKIYTSKVEHSAWLIAPLENTRQVT